jgi:hypothetical protein
MRTALVPFAPIARRLAIRVVESGLGWVARESISELLSVQDRLRLHSHSGHSYSDSPVVHGAYLRESWGMVDDPLLALPIKPIIVPRVVRMSDGHEYRVFGQAVQCRDTWDSPMVWRDTSLTISDLRTLGTLYDSPNVVVT